MKMLVLILSLLGSTAFAELRPMGTSVPNLCGYGPQGVICLGAQEPVPGVYISVSINFMEEMKFKIVKSTPIIGIINQPNSAVQRSAVYLDLIDQNGQKGVAILRSANSKIYHAIVQFNGRTYSW